MSGTTPKGWPYVTPDDHPKEYPSLSQTLAEKLDTFDAREATNAARVAAATSTYAPVWDQDNGAGLAIGNGTLAGRFARAGALGWAQVVLVRGSTTNLGTVGQGYRWTMPPALPAGDWRSIQGSGFITVGAVPIPVVVQAINAGMVRVIRCRDEVRVGAGTGAWNDTDSIQFTMTYRLN